MNMAKYCKSIGMDIQGYEQYKNNIESTAKAIIQYVKSMYAANTGMYYPIHEIISTQSKPENLNYIIQALKAEGMEFIENNSLWRY